MEFEPKNNASSGIQTFLEWDEIRTFEIEIVSKIKSKKSFLKTNRRNKDRERERGRKVYTLILANFL